VPAGNVTPVIDPVEPWRVNTENTVSVRQLIFVTWIPVTGVVFVV
jgi:hypothetical protein